LAVGFALDVAVAIAGVIAVSTALSNRHLGFPSGGLGDF